MSRSIRAYRFHLPLVPALSLGDQVCHWRAGVLLESAGRWAEASPLPGFSRETIEDVIAGLRGDNGKRWPTLDFALDSLARPHEEFSVPVNALLQGDSADVLARCKRIAESVCRTVKLKVGRSDLSEEAKLVKEVRNVLRSDQRLRLDANRAWSFAQATHFAEQIEGCEVEYIEEPLQDFRRMEDFYAQTSLAYALDETLLETSDLEIFQNAAALIYKPTILGGRVRIEQLARVGKPIVFSAAFESGIGIARIAELAQEYSPDIPAGLDTYSWLGGDVLLDRWQIADGRIRIGSKPRIDFGKVSEIKF